MNASKCNHAISLVCSQLFQRKVVMNVFLSFHSDLEGYMEEIERDKNIQTSLDPFSQKQLPRGVLQKRFFCTFTGKYLCVEVSFLIKLQTRPATLLKKRLQHRCFTLNFAKFLSTPFLQKTTGGCFLFMPVLYFIPKVSSILQMYSQVFSCDYGKFF